MPVASPVIEISHLTIQPSAPLRYTQVSDQRFADFDGAAKLLIYIWRSKAGHEKCGLASCLFKTRKKLCISIWFHPCHFQYNKVNNSRLFDCDLFRMDQVFSISGLAHPVDRFF